ncbi:MAG: hypothetical protein K2J50_05850, partial [Treponemataceae bacterium]|nr:hypothetical protein [Treponemataceae bacterium]
RRLWRRWCKHRVLMSKRHLQGKSPDPNAACGRKPFGSVAQKSATAPPRTAFDKIVRSGSIWVSDKIIEYNARGQADRNLAGNIFHQRHILADKLIAQGRSFCLLEFTPKSVLFFFVKRLCPYKIHL